MAVQNRQSRVGLVLGAGGVLGGAWIAGALAAVARATGWNPATASHIVGTSAGSVFAALVAAGVGCEELVPVASGALDAGGFDDWVLSELAGEDAYRAPWVPRLMPGSLRLALSGIRDPHHMSPLKMLSGLAPEGLVPTDAIQRTIARAAGCEVGQGAWISHPNCWIVACDYETGDRVVFGKDGGPPAGIDEAVAASCAIPGFFQPVHVGDAGFVDGGLHSMSNADLLADAGLDLVVVLNPLSSRAASTGWNPVARVAATVRRLAAWQIDNEVAQLLDAGTHVVVLEPTATDLAAIGYNVMDARRSIQVAETALETVEEQLAREDVAELMALLPPSRSAGSALSGLLRRVRVAAAAAFLTT